MSAIVIQDVSATVSEQAQLLRGLKIETFEGINDEPLTPTADKGGNISHMHFKHNELIESVTDTQEQLSVLITANFQTLATTITYLQQEVDNLRSDGTDDNTTPPDDRTTIVEFLALPLAQNANTNYFEAVTGQLGTSGKVESITVEAASSFDATEVSFYIDNSTFGAILTILNTIPLNSGGYEFIVDTNSVVSDVIDTDTIVIEMLDNLSDIDLYIKITPQSR